MTNICTSNLIINDEYWGSIDGYLNYEVSWFGRVRHAGTEQILEPRNTHQGYLTVYLYKNWKGKQHLVHRLVAHEWVPNPLEKRCVDHIDGDRMNNHHENLRFATHAENNRNSMKTNNTRSSTYQGVYLNKPMHTWMAYIRINGKLKNVGYYEIEKEAAATYNAAAVEHFGVFAKLNKIED
jgi:hypothetical protein